MTCFINAGGIHALTEKTTWEVYFKYTLSIHSSDPPSPFIKEGFDSFKIDGNGGGGLKIFARKGELGKMGGLSRNGDCHIILMFVSIEKNLDVFIFLLLTKMCYKIIT